MSRNLMNLTGTIVGTAFFLLTPPAFATHPLGTEEPETVAPLTVGAETTYEFNHYGGSEGMGQGEADLWIGTGLAEDLDLGMTIPHVHFTPDEGDSQAGLGDIEVTLKWHFLKSEGLVPGLAVKAGATFPTGDENKGLGSGSTAISATLLAEEGLVPVELYFNLSYARLLDAHEGVRENSYTASVAAQWEFITNVTAVGEVVFDSLEESGGTSSVTATAGAAWQILNDLGIDAGVRVGLTDAAPDWSVLAGVNLSFGAVTAETTGQ